MQNAPRFPAAAAALVLAAACAPAAHADFFGAGENRFEIPFVTVGHPGNPADTTGAPNPAGSVGYAYRIGKYEVPEGAITKAIAQSAAGSNPLVVGWNRQRGERKPATTLRWTEIARFVNWLNTEKGATPAYKFDGAGAFQLWSPGDAGYDPSNRFRNADALYFLPSADEWYKAAYYDPITQSYYDYATGSNDPPTSVASGTAPGTAVWNVGGSPADVDIAGGPSPYGTVAQTGNVFEWEETAFDLRNNSPLENRALRGGDWAFQVTTAGLPSSSRIEFDVLSRPNSAGFRIAARVPEPAAGFMVAVLYAAVACGRPRCS